MPSENLRKITVFAKKSPNCISDRKANVVAVVRWYFEQVCSVWEPAHRAPDQPDHGASHLPLDFPSGVRQDPDPVEVTIY